MNKRLLHISLFLMSQITGLYAQEAHPGVFFSSQFSTKAVERTLARIARRNATEIISKIALVDTSGISAPEIVRKMLSVSDKEVVDYVLQNPTLFASCPKTLVVVSDAPFNSRTEEFKKGREKLEKFPLIQAKFYNCPSFGALSQVLTAHPLIGSKIDTFLATKQAFGDGDKPNKFDEFVTLLKNKFSNKPWLNSVVSKIEKYRDSIQSSLKQIKQHNLLPDAQQWQESIRKENGFSQEDFQSLAHENIMHMLGIPTEEYSTILGNESLKRSVEWMGKLALTVGFGGAASDFLNWAMCVYGIEPEDCTKENVVQLLAAAREILDGVLNNTLTPEQQERAQALPINVNDAEIDDIAVVILMYQVNGKVDMILFGTKNVIDNLERQGFKKDTVSTVVDNVTVLPIVDQTLLNEKNALPIVGRNLEDWFKITNTNRQSVFIPMSRL